MTNKDETIAYLRQCPGNELADIMEQVLSSRLEADPEGEAFEYRMILGMASRENRAVSIGNIGWSPWQIAAVAYADHDSYSENFIGEPFCQIGQCANCQIELCSHVKNARCPICGFKVNLT